MTEGHTMQQPTDNIQSMFPRETGETGPAQASHVETQRSMDPRTTLEDYNRTMLEYTQRQISSFVDLDDNTNSATGGSSRSSQSSGNSGYSGVPSNGTLARQANGPPPGSTSAAAAAAASARHTGQHHSDQRSLRSPNEAKPSQY